MSVEQFSHLCHSVCRGMGQNFGILAVSVRGGYVDKTCGLELTWREVLEQMINM